MYLFDSGSGLCSHTDRAAACDARDSSQYLTFSKLGGIHNAVLPSETANAVCLMGGWRWGFGLGWVFGGLWVLVLFCLLICFLITATTAVEQDTVVLDGLPLWYPAPGAGLWGQGERSSGAACAPLRR